MKRTYSKNRPTATRLKGSIWIPTDIKEEDVDGTTQYSFINMEIVNNGQDITDQAYLDMMESQFKHERITEDYENTLANGFMTSLGFKIDCMSKNVEDFHQSLSLINLAGAETITVRDYNNVNHEVTTAQYQQLCLELGAYIMTKRQEKWAAIDAIGEN